MAGIKALAKETAIYGLSSIVGRFLNWCLVPLYAYLFAPAEYGIVSYLYSFTAVALVILNYGMETGFFRFASRHEDPMRVYSTSLLSVGSTSALFILLLTLFIGPVSSAIRLPGHQSYVWMLGVTVAVDAFSNIPFAYLRFRKKAVRFAGIKILNVLLNIGLNLFFLLVCPWLEKVAPQTIDWFYAPAGGQAFGIGWIFVANIISTLVVLLCLLPELCGFKYKFDRALLKQMLNYSWPLLVLGVAGIMSQNMGQMLIPYLFPDNPEGARTMVGIYGANIKIAIVMVMFTQAFRYAYEPFIFARDKAKGEDKKQAYCDAMKFFVIFGFFIFLAVMYYLPVLKHFVSKAYWPGLEVVPVMMAAELCMGVAFNLSLWYKLTDRTVWGMYLSVGCFVVMLALNLWLVPAMGIPDGYMGSAWAALISYFLMMVVSWLAGRHYYPLPYQWGRIALYGLLAAALWLVGEHLLYFDSRMWLTYLSRTLLLLVYMGVVVRFERPTAR
ncbi:MAG: polysaccharide biosynthesis protein [Bacteroidales bacterium]|nr:polysaccharide biosynthesis protein [Bacteroidales bacterium]